jgi:hypothetical protein
MSHDIDAAEKRVFRTVYEDGLWDILLGILLIGVGMSMWVEYLHIHVALFIAVVIPCTFASVLALWAAKRFITTPRVGLVRLGAKGVTRVQKTTLILVLSLIVTLLVVCSLVTMLRIGAPIQGRTLVTVLSVKFVIVFALAAWFLDFKRLYIWGLLYGSVLPSAMWLQSHTCVGFPIETIIAAGIIIGTGVVLLIRFLKTHPATDVEVDDVE